MRTRSSATASIVSSPIAKAAGVDGVLVVDYPPEECEASPPRCARRHRPDLPARAHLHRAAHEGRRRVASGYVYYVSLKGVTGAGHLDTRAVADDGAAHQGACEAAGRCRLRHPRRADAQAVGAVSDAVVIGPAMCNCSKRSARQCRRRGGRFIAGSAPHSIR
jgi:tryptophan synthase alpha chain